jgi:hypothetical protein
MGDETYFFFSSPATNSTRCSTVSTAYIRKGDKGYQFRLVRIAENRVDRVEQRT